MKYLWKKSIRRIVISTAAIVPFVVRFGGPIANTSGEVASKVVSTAGTVGGGCVAVIAARSCANSAKSIGKRAVPRFGKASRRSLPAYGLEGIEREGLSFSKRMRPSAGWDSLGAGRLSPIEGAGRSTIGNYGAMAVGGSLSSKPIFEVVAEKEAQGILRNTTTSMLRNQPGHFAPHKMPELFSKYPGFKEVLADRSKLPSFLKKNPSFIDDAALNLYRARPQEFARYYSESTLVRTVPSSFKGAVERSVEAENAAKVKSIMNGVFSRLRKQGIDVDALSVMESGKAEKLIGDALRKELNLNNTSRSCKWGYKSGKLFVKGDIGHFSYEQEVSVATLLKLGVAVGGALIAWDKIDFSVKNKCVGDFCINIEKKENHGRDPNGDVAVSIRGERQN